MTANVWNGFGLQSSPFFQEALDLSPTSLRPIDLFVGRERETEQALRRIVGNDSSRIVVSGAAGVGKTTFIQHIKAVLGADPGYAVAAEYCRVPHDLSATSLGVELLRAVLRSLRSVLSGKQLEALPGFEQARRLVEDTERMALQWNVSILGSGGGLSGDRRVDRPAFGPSQFHDALASLAAGARLRDVPGIVVHLNNLENLEHDPREAAALMRDARDYFLVPGLHLLLGATESFHTTVLATHAQVHSIFPAPVRLPSLGFTDVKALLSKRLAHLAISGMEATSPVRADLAREVYRLFGGDLRGMLSALEEACFRALRSLRTQPLSLDEARSVLAPLYRDELRAALSPSELRSLVQLARLGRDDFRQADVIKPLALSQSRVSKLLSALEAAHAIIPSRVDGRSRYYHLSGRAHLAFGTPAPPR